MIKENLNQAIPYHVLIFQCKKFFFVVFNLKPPAQQIAINEGFQLPPIN